LFFIALVVFHVLVCVALIIVVLLQSSKGEGLAGTAFGGGLGGAVFGGRGAGSFLSKATTVLAILFMVNSIGLAFMSSSRTGLRSQSTTAGPTESVVTREAQRAREQAVQQQQQTQQQQPSADSLLNVNPNPGTQPGQGQQTAPGDGQ